MLQPLVDARNMRFAEYCKLKTAKAKQRLWAARKVVKGAVAVAKNEWLLRQCETLCAGGEVKGGLSGVQA